MARGTEEQVVLRAVVADDNAVVLATLQQVLGEAHGIELVGQALSGDEAIALIKTQRPDVAVLDLGMPGGGEDLVAQVRALPNAPQVLIFSGRDDPETVQCMLAAGAGGFVSKGGLVEDFADLVRRCARGERVGLAAGAEPTGDAE